MGNRQRPTRKTRRRPPNLQQEELRGQAPSFPLRPGSSGWPFSFTVVTSNRYLPSFRFL